MVNEGKLRPFWRVLLFFGILNFITWAITPLAISLTKRYPSLNDLSAAGIAFGEGLLFLTALIATAFLAWYERRPIDSYGLPVRKAFSGPFWDGLLIGLIAPGLCGLGMLALHGWVIHGLNLKGAELLWLPLGWLAANILVGLGEEMWYRGYMLQTLTKSLGFWPAAVVLSLLFTSDHYFFKAGENVWDAISLFALGLFVCLSVRRTGTLWFAVGFHIAFDFTQLFLIGTENGSAVPVGRLFDSTFPGPAWVNGGVLGTEASFLMYPIIALLYVYLMRRYPRNLALTETPRLPVAGL